MSAAAIAAEKAAKFALAAAAAAKAAETCTDVTLEDDAFDAEVLQRAQGLGDKESRRQLKASAPWHKDHGKLATPRHSKDHGKSDSNNGKASDTTLWSAADFPSLAGNGEGSRTRSKSARRLETSSTPLRSRQRADAAMVTPNRSRRRSEGQRSQSHWNQHESPAPQLRRQSSSEQRCTSEQRRLEWDQVHCNSSNLPGKQAVEVSKARQDMAAIAQRMTDSAEQMKLVGCPDPEQYASFLSDHASMMHLAKTLQLTGPPNTAQADPAALVALNLLMVASSRHSMMKSSPAPMAIISENSSRMQTRSVSPMVSRVQSPSSLMVPMLMPVTRPSMTSSMQYDELRPWKNHSMMRVPSVESFRTPLRLPRRSSKYTVINPRSGEKLVISSAVPFRWRQSKRLRIVDPRTGEEVLPFQEDDDINNRDGHSCAGVMSRASRLSVSSTASSSAPQRSRKSLAGRAVQQGGGWALEPASGGHWDWPLSRQEKKDRILMLSQLELLAEIEEMQGAAMGDDKYGA